MTPHARSRSGAACLTLAISVLPTVGPGDGIYKLEGGGTILIGKGTVSEQPLVVFPDRQIRTLTGRSSSAPAVWTYGPALAVAEPVQGTIALSGPPEEGRILWTVAGQTPAQSAVRVPLHGEPLKFRGGGVSLQGTLTLPEGLGPFPAIVMAHGSGPETRDRSPLVYGFAERGYAVLAYDKRGTGESKGDWQTATLQDLARDLESAVKALRDDARIDAARVGVWGHSQGAWVTVLAASRSPHIAFVIAECGGGVSPIEQELYRGGNLLRLKLRMPEDQIAAVERFRRLKYQIAAGLAPRAGYEAEVARVRSEPWFRQTGDKLPDGFWLRNGAYDPLPALRALVQPSLFILAEHDVSTPLAATRAALESALAASRSRHSIVVLTDAGHELFETSRLTLPEEVGQMTHLAPRYVETLFGWLTETTGSPVAGR